MEYQDVLINQPVVFDNGSGTIKAGIAGQEKPSSYFPCYVGRPKHKRVMAGAMELDYFIGPEAQEHRGLLKIKYPMKHGIVTDWEDMERIWQHVYSDELKVKPEQHPVLLTEAPLNPRKNRERAAERFFEVFNVPAMYISIQAVLALYASGKTTGLVLDSGDGVTHAVPVYGGFAIPSAIQRIDLAGRDVTEYLQMLLRREGVALYTSAEKEIVRNIKERRCYVALDPRREEKEWATNAILGSTVGGTTSSGTTSRHTSNVTASGTTDEGVSRIDNINATASKSVYVLPDGKPLNLGAERFRAPELLFSPHIIGSESNGVHQIIADSISRTDLDLRPGLYENIVLSGGTTLFEGFGQRLLKELKLLSPRHTKIRITAPPERKYSTWIGGSILANLSTFRKMLVSAQEYQEDPSIIHRKCM